MVAQKKRVIPAQAARPGILEQFFAGDGGGFQMPAGGGGLQMGGGGGLQSSFKSPFGAGGALGSDQNDLPGGGYFPDRPQLGGIFPGAWDLSGMLGMPAQPQRTIFDQAATVAGPAKPPKKPTLFEQSFLDVMAGHGAGSGRRTSAR